MSKPRFSAIVLAAGLSKRMGPTNKLLADMGGESMLERVVNAVLASEIDEVVVVTGHEHERVEARLRDWPVGLVHNAEFEEGLASTLRRGLASVSSSVEAALIVLGDMPRVGAAHINRLLAAFADSQDEQDIVVPTYDTQRGNPVLFARCYFAELARVTGDVGGRALLTTHDKRVLEVPMTDDAVLIDVDEPAALERLAR